MAGGPAYTYDPYGNVTVLDTSWGQIGNGGASNTTVGNTIFFAGESFDTSTGLYFDRAATTIRSWAASLAKIRSGMPAAVPTYMPTAATTRRMRPTHSAHRSGAVRSAFPWADGFRICRNS